MRIAAHAHEDDRVEALEALLENYPRLRERYLSGDDTVTTFYLDIDSAYFDSNSDEPKVTLVP